LVPGTPEDVNQLNTILYEIKAWANGSIDTTNITDGGIATADLADGGVTKDKLATTVADVAGISTTSTVRRGASIIAASESRTNTAYGTLTTPDQVANVVLPSNGLIAVVYQAMWQESVAGAGRAALFIGANQLKMQTTSDVGPVTTAAATNSGANINKDAPLFTSPMGLVSGTTLGASYGADVSTGQVVGLWNLAATSLAQERNGVVAALPSISQGGLCLVFAAAGTYTVSIQYKSSSGSVTANTRKLWIWTLGF
jgi:hypothetical protein